MTPAVKKFLPHIGVILFFIAVTLVYFSPLFEGKELRQHDIAQWEGMSKEIRDFREKYDAEPLWTNAMFGGMPAYQISVLYPANLIRYVNDVLTLGIPAPYSYVFLSLLGFYILLLCLKIDYRIAIAGAIGYAFSSYNFIIIMAGHNSKMHAIALVPFAMAGILMVFNRQYLSGGIFTAIALSLQIYANHLQITYYLALTIFLLIIAELVIAARKKDLPHFLKSGVVLAIAAVLAVLPNITSLWATYEYGKYSTRGPSELSTSQASSGLDIEYAFGWSYGISETLTLLVPDMMGGASGKELKKNSATYKALVDNGSGAQALQFIRQAPVYWGDQPGTSGPVYIGAIIVFLFFCGALLVKNEYKYWLVIATVFFIVLSWGKNFHAVTDLFFYYLPGYNKFRTVSMTLALCSFTMTLLALMALSKLFDTAVAMTEKLKSIKIAFYITGGICLLLALIPGVFFDFSGAADVNYEQYGWLVAALREDRESILRIDALRSLFFIGLTAALIWLMLKNKVKAEYAIYGIAFLVLVDMWAVNKRYLNEDNFVKKSQVKQPFIPDAIDEAIMADKDLGFRVMNAAESTFNDASTSYFHHSIGGYHGAKLKRYQELIENQISKNNMAVLDMLNTRYFILPDEQGRGRTYQRNPGAMGPAWFVPEIRFVANADSEMTALTGFIPSQVVIVDERFRETIGTFKPQFDSTAVIKLVEYKPNHLTYTSNAASEQMAVFSEIYYDKGWNAYIDGNPAPYIRANYVLRAMRVPAGKHKIEFRFEPSVYKNGERIALAGSVLLLLLLAGITIREIKQKQTRSDQ